MSKKLKKEPETSWLGSIASAVGKGIGALAVPYHLCSFLADNFLAGIGLGCKEHIENLWTKIDEVKQVIVTQAIAFAPKAQTFAGNYSKTLTLGAFALGAWYWRTRNRLYQEKSLKDNEKLQKLSVDLLKQEKITQAFLRRFMEDVLDAWFDLEEKTEMALVASGNHRALAMEACSRRTTL